MKRVLIWGATDTIGGVEAVLWNYVSHISPEKIQFDFVNTYQDISIGEQVRKRGSKVIGLPNRKSDFFAYRKSITSFMKKQAKKYDAVWLNDCMFGNIDILKLAKKYGIPKRIIHAHNSLNMGGGKSRLLRHKINSLLLKFYVTDYWACSALAGNWSYPKSVRDAGLVKVIPNAVDVDGFAVNLEVRQQYRRALNITDTQLVFGHVGRFHFQKNHIFLIDIFSEVYKLVPNVRLWLIGTGEDEGKVKQRITEYGLEAAVSFMGTRYDVPKLLQAMDAFLLPSLFEGLPVVMVEAQAAGLPCFVADTITKESDISGNVEFYSLHSTKREWAAGIVNYMCKFIRKDVRGVMAENGYSIETAAKQLEREFNFR